MTPNSVIPSIRRAIHDPNGTRWSDAVLRQYIYEGEIHIIGDHPEAQYGARVANPDPVLATANTDTLSIMDDYNVALTHYVAYQALIEDSDDENNLKLAMAHYKLYQEAI